MLQQDDGAEFESFILHVVVKRKCMPVWLKRMLKARSVWPQTCLDLLYLDRGPHPVQSL